MNRHAIGFVAAAWSEGEQLIGGNGNNKDDRDEKEEEKKKTTIDLLQSEYKYIVIACTKNRDLWEVGPRLWRCIFDPVSSSLFHQFLRAEKLDSSSQGELWSGTERRKKPKPKLKMIESGSRNEKRMTKMSVVCLLTLAAASITHSWIRFLFRSLGKSSR
jgi:hypothetical protein